MCGQIVEYLCDCLTSCWKSEVYDLNMISNRHSSAVQWSALDGGPVNLLKPRPDMQLVAVDLLHIPSTCCMFVQLVAQTCNKSFAVDAVDLLHVFYEYSLTSHHRVITASRRTRPSRTVTRWTKTTTTTTFCLYHKKPLLLLRSLSNAENDASSVRVSVRREELGCHETLEVKWNLDQRISKHASIYIH